MSDPVPQTISEKILSSRSGRHVRAGEIAICRVDRVVGTDGSGPMAIDYFERMGGTALFDPERVCFSLDHYAPPDTAQTRAFHDRIRDFAARHGATIFDVGEGVSHQIVVERGLVQAGDLLIGADSHAVTCGALNAFAIGVGSSDLAAAMLTGRIWLRVPESIRIDLFGVRPAGLAAKDIALAITGELGAEGAGYHAIEFVGDAVAGLPFDDRLVLCNLMVETGAKAAMFQHDDVTAAYLAGRGGARGNPVSPDPGARYARTLSVDLARLSPRIARPHAPDNVIPLSDAGDVPVHMVFIGTCTGGRVVDFHEARDTFDRAGGRLAPGVQLVLTPASREVVERLMADGTLDHFVRAGAIVTTAGCGACCGTSGVIPADGMTVLSTANRNFKARMGNASASIYLASPAACGAAAATGRIPTALQPPEGDA
jgi:3-isopropylmalate/(R)-2-methylmalate dehydratase large subunit